jgi:hypothetical protein
LRAKLWNAGFRPVACWTVEADRKRGQRAQLGKHPYGPGWQNLARQNPPHDTVAPPRTDALNTGLLADGLRPIDLDIDDPAIANDCLQIAWEMFPGAPIRYRDDSPRRLVLVRAETGQPPKITLTGATHTTEHACKIEVLGQGQQFVAFGDHESGTDLRWTTPPGDLRLGDLPSASEDNIRHFLEACAPIIGGPARKRANGEDHQSSEPQANPLHVAAALAAIPNDGPPDWEAWNRVGMATWRATGGSSAGWEAFNAWSSRNPAFDPGATRERWDRYRKSPPTKIGAGTIFHLAKQHGWRDPHPEDDPAYLQALEDEARRDATHDSATQLAGTVEVTPPLPTPEVPPDFDERFPPQVDEAFAWPEPIDIFGDLIGAPVLTRDHLPNAISPFVFDTSERLGVDPAATALCAVIVCSSVINDDWKIQPKQEDYKWTESARLWGMLLGGVSMKKSPTIRSCTNPIDKLDAKARTQHDEDMREHKQKHAAWKKRSGGDTPDDPEPKPPRLVRYLSDSTTIEALSDILRSDAEAKQIAPAKKILVRQDEMSEFFANLDRYNAGGRGGGDRGAYLRLYNGGRWTTDRVIRGNFAVENWSACLLGGIQPEPIQRIAHETADDGMLQRMLYHVGIEEAGDGIDKKPDHAAYKRYESIIAHLAVSAPKKRTNGRINPIVLHADARAYWDAHRQLLKGVTAMPDTSGRMKAAIEKWPATFCRIALTFHMIEAADRALASTAAGLQVTPVSDVLSPETAHRTAAYIRDVLLPHLLRADALMFSTTQSEHAKWVAGYILARKLTQIQTRDIIRAYKPLRPPELAAERESILTSLAIAGWLEPLLPSVRNPARPVSTWLVNPRVHQLFASRAKAEAKRRAEAKEAIAEATAARRADGKKPG